MKNVLNHFSSDAVRLRRIERARRRAGRAPRKNYDRLPHRSGPPIIVLGFNKTFTTSLHNWFLDSNIPSLHWGGFHAKNNLATRMFNNHSAGLPVLSGMSHYCAFSDLSYSDGSLLLEANTLFRDIHRDYEDAYFILNHRPTTEWVRSRMNHTRGAFLDRACSAYGLPEEDVTALWTGRLPAFLAEVRSYFADHPAARLLEFDASPSSQAALIEFLSPDYRLIPDGLQHSNKTHRTERSGPLNAATHGSLGEQNG